MDINGGEKYDVAGSMSICGQKWASIFASLSRNVTMRNGGLCVEQLFDAPFEMLQYEKHGPEMMKLLNSLGYCMTACLAPDVRTERIRRNPQTAPPSMEVESLENRPNSDVPIKAFLQLIGQTSENRRYLGLRNQLIMHCSAHLKSTDAETQSMYLACAFSTFISLAAAMRGARGGAEKAVAWWDSVGKDHLKDLLVFAKPESLSVPEFLEVKPRHAFVLLRTRLFYLLHKPFSKYMTQYEHASASSTCTRSTFTDFLLRYIVTHGALLFVELETFYEHMDIRIACLLDVDTCLTLSTFRPSSNHHERLETTRSGHSPLHRLPDRQQSSLGVTTPDKHEGDPCHQPAKRTKTSSSGASVPRAPSPSCAQDNSFALVLHKKELPQSPYDNVCSWLSRIRTDAEQLANHQDKNVVRVSNELMERAGRALAEIKQAHRLQTSGITENRPCISFNSTSLVSLCRLHMWYSTSRELLKKMGVVGGNAHHTWSCADTIKCLKLGKLRKSGQSVSQRDLSRIGSREIRPRNNFTYTIDRISAGNLSRFYWQNADTQINPKEDKLDQRPHPDVIATEHELLQRWEAFLAKIKTVAIWRDFLTDRYVDVTDEALRKELKCASTEIDTEVDWICGDPRMRNDRRQVSLMVTISNAVAMNVHYKKPPTLLAAPIAGTYNTPSDPRRVHFAPTDKLKQMIDERALKLPCLS